jgi:hypothetical protein
MPRPSSALVSADYTLGLLDQTRTAWAENCGLSAELAIAKVDLGHAEDAIHHARVALEGISAELERRGLYQLADQVARDESRLLHADPFAAPGEEAHAHAHAWG